MKEYIKPVIIVEEIELEDVIASSSESGSINSQSSNVFGFLDLTKGDNQ